MACCDKLDRQGCHIADHLRHWSILGQRVENLRYKFSSYGYESAGKHVILIQYVNAQDKFRYPFPHPQFLWYLGYRIGIKCGTREEK